jgi:hypothetical protein
VKAAPKPDMFTSFKNTMGFAGWAPETINGRVAQIGTPSRPLAPLRTCQT